jgi:hypothetical protein
MCEVGVSVGVAVLVCECFVYFGFWPLAHFVVMLNLFQHLTASLYLLPLLGEILKRVQDDV